MPKYTADEVRKAMDRRENIRNFCLVGGQQHGKTSLVDNLGANVGYLAPDKIGEARFMNQGRADEKEKGVTLKTNSCAMVYQTKYNPKNEKGELEEEKEDQFLLNLLDCPGHMEYSPEVAGGIRMSDGFVCVVDVTSGVNVLTEYTLNDCLKEKLRPTLFVNTIDKAILVMEKSGEEIYQECAKAVMAVNLSLMPGEKYGIKNCNVDPSRGDVIFGSALYGWAFTLEQFAKIYAAKFKQEVSKFMPRLWGDQFFNPAKKTWTKSEVDGSVRGFCQFIMNPILQMHTAVMGKDGSGPDMAKIEKMCGALSIDLVAEDKKLEGKALLRRVMSKWMNAGDALAKMVATHLPSPLEAQKYRTELIYRGEMDTDIAKAMQACDPEGPVMMQICRLVPTGSAGRFYGLGRLFSGTVTPDKFIVRAPEYDPEDPETAGFSQDGRLQSVGIFFGKDYTAIGSAPCGNILGVNGVDQYMVKTATVTNKKAAGNFAAFKFNVSPVLKVAIRPSDPKQLPKLVEGLKRLMKSDMLVQTKSEATGDHIIMGCGDEHLKTLLRDLKNEHACIDFVQGVPTVSYKETVTMLTEKDALSKSPNKHNRLYVKAEPIAEDLCVAIEEYKINPQQDVKKRARILIDEFGWEKTDCMKLWGFGPADIGEGGANVLIDQTKGIQYLNEIKESVNSGLLWASASGPLAEENMRGCRFNLMDCKLHADSIHRGMGQIQPTARRVFFAAVLTSEPRFMEPFFKVTIACPEEAVSGVSQAIAAKRGELIEQKEVDGKQVIDCFLPIAETIGDEPFSKKLQMNTSGKAFATYVPDHWEIIDNNPLQTGSKTEKIMFDIRERKGLKVEQPILGDYLDKL